MSASIPGGSFLGEWMYLIWHFLVTIPHLPRKMQFSLVVGIIAGSVLFSPAPKEVSIGGETVFLTGASQGLGEQMAYSYAKRGANLVITARSQAKLLKVSEQCKLLGAKNVLVVVADMDDNDDIERLLQTTLSTVGKVSHLVLNHAYQTVPNYWQSSADNLTESTRMFNTNFFSYQLLASRFMQNFGEKGGRILVVSSIMGEISMPFFGSYSATKHAVQAFFESLQYELHMKGSATTITLGVLGRIDTEKQRTLTCSGNFIRHGEYPPAANVKETAEKLIGASLRREHTLFHPKTMNFVNAFYHFPGVKSIFKYVVAFQMQKK